ncbi:hypothetical protein NWT09_22125 [Mycolicibacterium sp. jd]|uniref:hypothetical protein n=1 Tax=unclassified Mycolicibacterium TaxID=2636767 RepID=UPI00351AC088
MSIGIREFRTLHDKMRSNTVLTQELAAIEGFDNACNLAERARTLLGTLTQPEPAPWPTTAAEVTEEWLNTAAAYDTTAAQSKARYDLLAAVVNQAEQDAVSRAERAGTCILQNLHIRLTDTIGQVRDLKALGGVLTASDAIVKDFNEGAGRTSVDAWQTLTELSNTYEDIRDAQQKVMSLFFSEYIARYGTRRSADPLASELHAQNLDAAWGPNWRDRTDTPWPADPAEKLLWLARSNAQPWVPTPGQLKRTAKERLDEARATAGQQNNVTLSQARPTKPATVGIYG